MWHKKEACKSRAKTCAQAWKKEPTVGKENKPTFEKDKFSCVGFAQAKLFPSVHTCTRVLLKPLLPIASAFSSFVILRASIRILPFPAS